MPNWCDVSLTIKAANADILEHIVARAEAARYQGLDGPGLLQAYLPMPSEYLTMEGYDKYGYDWAVRTWGVKWPDHHTKFSQIRVDGDAGWQIGVHFVTPWGPPVEGIQRISGMFDADDNVRFIMGYYGEGPEFAGATYMKNGEVEAEMEVTADDLVMSWVNSLDNIVESLGDGVAGEMADLLIESTVEYLMGEVTIQTEGE